MSAIRKAFDRMMTHVLSRQGELKPDFTTENPKYVTPIAK
jgi:hypothetical protein